MDELVGARIIDPMIEKSLEEAKCLLNDQVAKPSNRATEARKEI
jgi:hypothetical protein